MTEPVITINGRPLIEAQAMAVRVAILAYHQEMADPLALGDDEHGKRMTEAYRDRLGEVLSIMAGVVREERAQQERMLSNMHQQRRDRILQLAGIVPEQATEQQIRLALGYVATALPPDEAAVRLMRALEKL